MNRSQRCGVCRGCQSKPCGHCVYCQDSPQFGGPGVKKQSCIERRCLRVLENRLQRDGPTFKAKAGCQSCDECLSPDCQVCLVCLDRKFFENRYLPGAMCAKKRCNQSRTLELPYLGPPPGIHHQAQNGMEYQQQQIHQHPHPHLITPHPHPPPIAPHPGIPAGHAIGVMDGVYASVFHNGVTHHYLTGPPSSPGANKRMSPSEPFDRDGSPRKRRPQDSAPTAATLLATAGPVPLNGAVSVAISHHPIIQAQCMPHATMTLNGGAALWTPQRVPLSSSPQVSSPSTPSPHPQYPGVSCQALSPDPYAYRPLGLVDVNQNPPTSSTEVKYECKDNNVSCMDSLAALANVQSMQPMYTNFAEHQMVEDKLHRLQQWQEYGSMTSPSAVLGAPEQLIPPSLSGKHQVVLQPL